MITLDRLVNVLASSGARLVCCPRSRDVLLRSLIVHDPTDTRVATGDVFLAVGLDTPDVAVRLAARARAAVALVRAPAPLEPTVQASAEEAGVAVVLAEPEVSWSHLTGLAYGLVLEGRETEAGRGPTDLFALADTLAATVGGPVVIEDQLSRVLAYSSLDDAVDAVRSKTILGRRLPETIRGVFAERGVFRHLASSDLPLFVAPSPQHGLDGRMVVAVRAGRELLGSLWVESDGPFDERRCRILEDGARTAALHLLRSRASADLERQVESDLVTRLLEGTGDGQAMISQLGLTNAALRVVALQAHVDEEQHAGVLLVFEHVTTGFGWSRWGRSALFANTVYTVLPMRDETPDGARSWVESVRAAMPSHISLHAGIGGPADAMALPASRREADEGLALHVAHPGSAPIAYDESWDRILLRRLRAIAADGRVPERGPVVELRRHDEQHGTRYIDTLRAWLAAHGDIGVTAAQLDVHPNTVRYRLRKMNTATHLAIDRPEQRIAMFIALAATDDEHA
ncbi:PucR family transcriptional regulator [Actinomycetospora chibensis]|uniref:PucR family transcriptional regulator n=1 Tax=Actinomycetospora chibensis TaxID=663606 RepID=A0ABV9RQN6_9PSEU|nr:helix-turn-helix domain-containing protein [Actinomycetospora chibensis]MDD7923222.1 helix-turn-helix domain-containing protein [Actinomycetospora chibensis]